jgi:hypothetical protein
MNARGGPIPIEQATYNPPCQSIMNKGNAAIAKLQHKAYAVGGLSLIAAIGGCIETFGVGCALTAFGGTGLGGITISDYNESAQTVFNNTTSQLNAAGCTYVVTSSSW